MCDPSWSPHPCMREYHSPLFTWMEERLCSERISPFLHSFHEDKFLIFSVHNLALDAPLFLTRGLLLENIGECIKTLRMIMDTIFSLTESKMTCLSFSWFILKLIHPSLVEGSYTIVFTNDSISCSSRRFNIVVFHCVEVGSY